MSGYTGLAAAYDKLMSANVDYRRMCGYVMALFSRHGHMPEIVLDAACGTGSLALQMLKRGIEVIGADASADMLAMAAQKAAAKGLVLPLVNQPLEKLDLYGSVDGAVCTLDSLNHITGRRELYAAIKNIGTFLRPGGLFVFDVNTRYKHSHVLANRVFTYDLEDVFCTWQNRTKGDVTRMTLDIFSREGTLWRRDSDTITERHWPHALLRDALAAAGMRIAGVYGEYTFGSPRTREERVFYVAKRVAWKAFNSACGHNY